MRSVLHRDRVRVRLLRLDRKGRPEGRVVDILERRKTPIIGRLLHEGGQWLVAPEDSRYGQDILIPKNATASAAPQKAMATLQRIGRWSPCRSANRPAGSARNTWVSANSASSTPTAAAL